MYGFETWGPRYAESVENNQIKYIKILLAPQNWSKFINCSIMEKNIEMVDVNYLHK